MRRMISLALPSDLFLPSADICIALAIFRRKHHPDRENTSRMSSLETRKLAAIMFTDIAGFSRQMGADEPRMLRGLEVHNHLIQHAVADHHGHVIKTMGDSFLVDF